MDQTTLTLPEAEKLLGETLAAYDRSPRTVETYTLMLDLFSRYLKRVCPDKTLDIVTPADVEAYQRYLVTERKVGFSSFNQASCALRFFYRTCLDQPDWTIARMPYQRKRRVLPEILAAEEVAAIFDACHNLKHKALLMTSYSGGLRLRETLGLLPSDIDSKRMVIRVEQGKGKKDRYVMLSRMLLDELRGYWKAFRPVRWLFEGRVKGEPLSPSTAEKVSTPCRRAGRDPKGGFVSFAAPRLRHPPPRGRHQHRRDPGPTGPPVPHHHSGLHPRGPHLRQRDAEPAGSAATGTGVGDGDCGRRPHHTPALGGRRYPA